MSPPVQIFHAETSDSTARLLRGLNREQRRAVTHDIGPALVIAGPGTGKTEVVTRRIAWLIGTRRAKPREILALTFTDNAASEMQSRVDMLVPYGQADAAIQTFHAFGDRLVREYAFDLGLGSNLRLLKRAEQGVFIREHLFELGLERYLPLGDPTRFVGALADLFGRAKDELVSVEALAEDARGFAARLTQDGSDAAELDVASSRAELARAYERYEALMTGCGYLDHADQIALALRLARTRPSVVAELRRRYRYVLVDELQDTNRAQLELVAALAGPKGNVLAVGDPAQGIYGFRGAVVDNVDRMRASFPTLKTIALRRNYRSLAPVVEAAERVLALGRAEVALQPVQTAHRRQTGTPVRHVAFATPSAEADGVAQEIARRIERGAEPGHFCVLVRSNSETDEFARSLRVRGIDVETGAVPRLYDVPQVRALLAFLRVVADPSNSLELFTLASAAPYAIEGSLLTRLLTGSRRRNRSLLEALRDALDTADRLLGDDGARRVAILVKHVEAGIGMAATHTSGEVLYDHLHRSGALTRLARASDGEAEAQARSVARFCELVRNRALLLESDRVPFLVGALELDNVADDVEPSEPSRDAVRVLTVHRAKGLEFRCVFVCGLVDGRFPVRSRPPVLRLPESLVPSPTEDEALAEERRLFYVALTRARDEVVLTSHEFGSGGRTRRRPSPFIAEAIDAPVATMSATTASGTQADAIARVLLSEPDVARKPVSGSQSLTLSYSQLDEYMSCPERYRLRYDIGIPTPAHHALSYGSAVHQAIAAFHSAQANGVTLTDDELAAELRRAWQPDGFLSREHEDARFAAGVSALRAFRAQQLAAGGVAPNAIERPFTFRLGRDAIRGRIDRMDATPEGAVITDYKSSDVREQKRADARARDSLQLQVYALAHQAETGELPALLQLHFVESGLVGSTVPTPDRVDKARAKLMTAADKIRAREFDPTPSPITCGYCPFRQICSASAA